MEAQAQQAQQRSQKAKKPPAQLWTIPKLWPGSDCYIIGGGPSLQLFDIERLRGKRVIVVNNAYKEAYWADVCFFGDCRWFNLHQKALLEFGGLKVTTCKNIVEKPGILAIHRKFKPTGKLSRNPQFVVWNTSSGACAMNLATLFGVKRIVLLGFDMRVWSEVELQELKKQCKLKSTPDYNNWHSDHPDSNNPRKNPYGRFLRPFPSIAKELEDLNVECLNATPGSALDVFPRIKAEELPL